MSNLSEKVQFVLFGEPRAAVRGRYGHIEYDIHQDRSYITGPIADRLYAFESLGYEPGELKAMLELYLRGNVDQLNKDMPCSECCYSMEHDVCKRCHLKSHFERYGTE